MRVSPTCIAWPSQRLWKDAKQPYEGPNERYTMSKSQHKLTQTRRNFRTLAGNSWDELLVEKVRDREGWQRETQQNPYRWCSKRCFMIEGVGWSAECLSGKSDWYSISTHVKLVLNYIIIVRIIVVKHRAQFCNYYAMTVPLNGWAWEAPFLPRYCIPLQFTGASKLNAPKTAQGPKSAVSAEHCSSTNSNKVLHSNYFSQLQVCLSPWTILILNSIFLVAVHYCVQLLPEVKRNHAFLLYTLSFANFFLLLSYVDSFGIPRASQFPKIYDALWKTKKPNNFSRG